MDNKFNWKPFKGRGLKMGTYMISVIKTSSETRGGGFGFLSGFYHKENISNLSHVSLFYDEERETIGFKFNNDKDYPGAFKLTKSTGSASVFPSSFWSAFNIDVNKWAGRYIPKHSLDEELGKIYYIDLKEKQ